MKFLDYFTNDFETHDNHYLPELQTRYYRGTKDTAKNAVLELIKEEGANIVDDNDNYGELLFETGSYSCICTIANPRTMGESSIDFKITTNALLPFGKGKKVIERMYKSLDKKLVFIASGAVRG